MSSTDDLHDFKEFAKDPQGYIDAGVKAMNLEKHDREEKEQAATRRAQRKKALLQVTHGGKEHGVDRCIHVSSSISTCNLLFHPFHTILTNHGDNHFLSQRQPIPPTMSSRQIFPFLSLPSELRDRIYKHALVHNRSQDLSASPTLLRVCRQIHNEALDILYSSSTLNITACFHLFDDNLNNPVNHLTITGDVDFTHISTSTLASYLEILPQHLLEVENLVLNLYIDNTMRYGHTELDFKKTNHFLTSFSTFLHHGERHSSQTLNISFFFNGIESSDPVFRSTLYPVAKIPSGIILSLSGLEDDLKDHLTTLRTSSASAGRDTLGDWLRLRRELTARGEKGWKAKYGVVSVDLMVGGKGTVLKEGNDEMLAHAVDIVVVRRRTAEMSLEAVR